MGKKFCPQCNRNVRVVRRGGHVCCPCCGFKADYMGPAICEQYSATRPPTQNQVMVKPDEHDHDDRTFSRYTAEDNKLEESPRTYRLLAISVTVVSLVLALLAMFVEQFTWNFEEEPSRVSTMFQLFMDQELMGLFLVFMFAMFLMTAFAPRYLGIIYFIIGFSSLFVCESMSLEYGWGLYAFFVSLAIGYLIDKWEKSIGVKREDGVRFARRFWFGESY